MRPRFPSSNSVLALAQVQVVAQIPKFQQFQMPNTSLWPTNEAKNNKFFGRADFSAKGG